MCFWYVFTVYLEDKTFNCWEIGKYYENKF